MKGYLKEHSEEVIETLMLQWDNELAMQARFEEGREEGIEFVALNMVSSGGTRSLRRTNYHALQLLKYLYARKVDCIYIDSPYSDFLVNKFSFGVIAKEFFNVSLFR